MSNDEPAATAPERPLLQYFLDTYRAEILGLLDGLTEEQARRRLVPSRTTLLGIVKHVAFAESLWLHASLTERTRAELGLPEDGEESWVLDDEDTIASISGAFRAVTAESDRLAAEYDLDHVGTHSRKGDRSLRWMYVHLIEELARHAGHGDILREQILAADASDAPATGSTVIEVTIEPDLMRRAEQKAATRGETVDGWLTKKLAQYAEFANDVPASQRHSR